MGAMRPSGPFRVRCLLCGEVAESWHRDFPAPAGVIIGMVRCRCGNVEADAMGLAGMGRVLSRGNSDSYEIER